MCMSFISTLSTYIALNALEIVMRSVNSIDIYSIYSNAIVYCVWYLVRQHCQYEEQSTQCLLRLSVHWCLWLLHNTLYRIIRGVKTRVSTVST